MMKVFSRILLFALIVQITIQKLHTNNKFGPPDLTDYEYADNDHRINRYHQAIIPSYKFDDCGNITAWAADVFYDDQNSYTLDFQVWRPSPTVDNSTGIGCYSLVGNNRFTSISLTNDLAIVIPSPQDYIQYQPGDVLGFYVENASRGHNGIVLRTSPSYLTSELVWFASITGTAKTSMNGDCPYSVGSDGVLDTSTRAAPVISLAMAASFSCYSSKVSSSPTVSTSPPTLTMVATMPAHVKLTVSATPTFLSPGILVSKTSACNNTSNKCCSTSCADPTTSVTISQKQASTLKPEWVVPFVAMIAFLVVIIIVLVLVIIKLVKHNKQNTKWPGETNYYDVIQITGAHDHGQSAADMTDMNTTDQCENGYYDYPAMLFNWRASVEVENVAYTTTTNA